MTTRLTAILAFAGTACAAALPTSARAQQADAAAPPPQDAAVIEEIVVTAQKRAEDVQSVPLAMSVLTSAVKRLYSDNVRSVQ